MPGQQRALRAKKVKHNEYIRSQIASLDSEAANGSRNVNAHLTSFLAKIFIFIKPFLEFGWTGYRKYRYWAWG